MVEQKNTTTIRVTNEFKDRLALHGQFGERFEDILIRLLGKGFEETATGDKKPKSYPKDHVNTRSTNKARSYKTENPKPKKSWAEVMSKGGKK